MDPDKESFENFIFNPFQDIHSRQDDERDPDMNYYNEFDSSKFDTCYFDADEVKELLSDVNNFENISVIHVNIRSLKQNIDKLS